MLACLKIRNISVPWSCHIRAIREWTVDVPETHLQHQCQKKFHKYTQNVTKFTTKGYLNKMHPLSLFCMARDTYQHQSAVPLREEGLVSRTQPVLQNPHKHPQVSSLRRQCGTQLATVHLSFTEFWTGEFGDTETKFAKQQITLTDKGTVRVMSHFANSVCSTLHQIPSSSYCTYRQ